MWNCVVDKDTDRRLSLKLVISLLSDIETKLNLYDAKIHSAKVHDFDPNDGEPSFDIFNSVEEKKELSRLALIQP